jgi:4'-phosphopantetheinyl transferase
MYATPSPPQPASKLDAGEFAAAFANFLGGTGGCFVVAIGLNDIRVDDASRIISAEERAEGERFVHIDDRRRFILGRAGLRCLLSRTKGMKVPELVFRRSEFGKLSLAGGPFFNLAHSGGLILIGVDKSAEIGVDVEAIRSTPDWPALADHYLTQDERDLIAASARECQEVAFLSAWTRKEAVIKAAGLGLSLSLQSFSVLPSQANWTVAAASGPLQDQVFCCFDLAFGDAHVGAVALAQRASSCTFVAASFTALLGLAHS